MRATRSVPGLDLLGADHPLSSYVDFSFIVGNANSQLLPVGDLGW